MRIEIEVSDDTLGVLVEAVADRLRLSRDTSSDYMTVLEAAEYLRCSRQRIYDMTSARRLPHYKFGSRVLLSRAEVDAWLAEQRVGQPAHPGISTRLQRRSPAYAASHQVELLPVRGR